MPDTADSLGVSDPFRPEENVWGGTRYLREMLDRYRNVRHALAAYNAGPSAVDRFGGVPPYPETQEYVDRVLDYYRRYHGDFGR
jgi:soluble lytic murein transglycosylase-like protein